MFSKDDSLQITAYIQIYGFLQKI